MQLHSFFINFHPLFIEEVLFVMISNSHETKIKRKLHHYIYAQSMLYLWVYQQTTF